MGPEQIAAYVPYGVSTGLGVVVGAAGLYLMRQQSLPPSVLAVLRFLLHAVVGITAFSVVALSAVGIHMVTHSLEPGRVSEVVSSGLVLVEHVIFLVDLALLLIFLLRTCAEFVHELYEQ